MPADDRSEKSSEIERAALPESELAITPGGVIVYGILPVGRVLDGRLTVNLGWAKCAGLSVRVLDDPEEDRHRDGVALDRDYPARPVQ